MSDDLVTWLRAQLDEDERIASEADPGPWRVQWDGQDMALVSSNPRWPDNVAEWTYAIVTSAEKVEAERADCDIRNPTHIAHWDPARVLAEVEAKRRIIDMHGPRTVYSGAIQCEYCADLCHSRSGLGCNEPDAPYPCDTVRLLALPYADRPGYREEWRP